MGYEEFLCNVDAFKTLNEPKLKRLASQVQPMSFAPKQQIIRRGDPGDAMYIIRSGEVRVPIVDETGREKFTARLGPGEFFGEMALLTGEPRGADVFAVGAVECLVIAKEPLQAFLTQNSQVASFLTEILGKRLLESEQIRQVGKYRLIGELGRGGMAIVYEGLHPTLNRTVAIKMLSHELVYDQDFCTRFKNEGKIIAGLRHDNIVEVYDSEEAYATYFIVMEKVSGTVLSSMIESQRIVPYDQTRTYLSQTASALHYAHSHGIVHRDVKPSNVIIEDSGRVKLMDFGIAKTRSEEEGQEEDIVGTAEYMSPEQAMGRKMDGRADMYSLGIVAFEMLTGRLPFDSEDPYDILRMHVRTPMPDPKKFNPEAPDDLVEIVMKSTAKSPNDRLRNCQEIVDILEKAEAAKGVAPALRQKVISILFPDGDEAKVAPAVQRALHELRRLPGVRVGLADFGRIN